MSLLGGCAAQVVVLRKRDFLDLDNPLLAWMLDYDAVSAVLKSLPAFKSLKQDQMEHIFDRFEARQELYKGDTILTQGALVRNKACSGNLIVLIHSQSGIHRARTGKVVVGCWQLCSHHKFHSLLCGLLSISPLCAMQQGAGLVAVQ